jgi:hypothetical protein
MYYPLYPHHIPKYSPMFIPMISPLHSHCMPLYHSFCWLIPIKSPLNPHYLFFYKSNHENHHHSHYITIESFENTMKWQDFRHLAFRVTDSKIGPRAPMRLTSTSMSSSMAGPRSLPKWYWVVSCLESKNHLVKSWQIYLYVYIIKE